MELTPTRKKGPLDEMGCVMHDVEKGGGKKEEAIGRSGRGKRYEIDDFMVKRLSEKSIESFAQENSTMEVLVGGISEMAEELEKEKHEAERKRQVLMAIAIIIFSIFLFRAYHSWRNDARYEATQEKHDFSLTSSKPL